MDWIGRIGFRVLARKVVALFIQYFDLKEFQYHWITEVEFEDLLENDVRLVYEHCGLYTLLNLWHNLPGLTIYISEKSYFDVKRRYIKKYFRRDDPERNVKALAAKLGVSEKFIYDAIGSTEEKEERQVKLI